MYPIRSPGHRQVLGVRVDGYGGVVVGVDVGVGKAVENDAAVGLVADQEDLCPILLLLLPNQLTQPTDDGLGVQGGPRGCWES